VTEFHAQDSINYDFAWRYQQANPKNLRAFPRRVLGHSRTH